MNELKEICDRLEGYGQNPEWVIVEAKRNDDGTWHLVIKRPAIQEEENADN